MPRVKQPTLLEVYSYAEPEDILTFITISGVQYALVKWSHFGNAYVPYSFIRKHLQYLIIKYMKKEFRFRYCPEEYFQDASAGLELPSDHETQND